MKYKWQTTFLTLSMVTFLICSYLTVKSQGESCYDSCSPYTGPEETVECCPDDPTQCETFSPMRSSACGIEDDLPDVSDGACYEFSHSQTCPGGSTIESTWTETYTSGSGECPDPSDTCYCVEAALGTCGGVGANEVELCANPTSGDWPLTVEFKGGYVLDDEMGAVDDFAIRYGDGAVACNTGFAATHPECTETFGFLFSTDCGPPPCDLSALGGTCYDLPSHTYTYPGSYDAYYIVHGDTTGMDWYSNPVTITVTGDPPSVGHIRAQGPSGMLKLNLKNPATQDEDDVVRVRMADGSIGLADLILPDPLDLRYSPVRIMTPMGVRTWALAP